MKKLRILVVEDTDYNIAAAKVQLKMHKLTIVEGYDQARNLLQPEIDNKLVVELLNKRLPKGWVCNGHDGVATLTNPEGETDNEFTCPDDIRPIVWQARKDAPVIRFDVVLTDVMIPKGGDQCMNEAGVALARRQGPMPYGPVIALHALQIGIKKVGILTGGNHHVDPFVFAFDRLTGFTAGDVKVVCSNNCHIKHSDDKDWASLLKKLV